MEVRRQPSVYDVLALKPSHRLRAGDSYSVTAQLSLPNEATLQNAHQNYPTWITDRYLQLPNTLPTRVVELTRSIAGGASNPYENAVAIETYLRKLKYIPSSSPLPYDADAVDHFLFESNQGYSDYFASAMTVMLRALGIPARLALGFGPGEEDTENRSFTIRDKDSHSWTEAFFPGVGWVEFEPTPIYERRPRGLLQSPFGIGFLESAEQSQEETSSEEEPTPQGDGGKLEGNVGGPLPGGFGLRPLPLVFFGSPLGKGGALFFLFLLVGGLALLTLWRRTYGAPLYPERAYERVHRLASFLGISSPPSRTPFEFAQALSQVVPQARSDIDLICSAFVRHRYWGRGPTTIEGLRIGWAWNRVRRALLGRLTTEAHLSPSNL